MDKIPTRGSIPPSTALLGAASYTPPPVSSAGPSLPGGPFTGNPAAAAPLTAEDVPNFKARGSKKLVWVAAAVALMGVGGVSLFYALQRINQPGAQPQVTAALAPPANAATAAAAQPVAADNGSPAPAESGTVTTGAEPEAAPEKPAGKSTRIANRNAKSVPAAKAAPPKQPPADQPEANPTEAPPEEKPEAPPFSVSAAQSALASASSGAQACKSAGGPTGSGRVTVTFAPSGRATSASVSGGDFAGSRVGRCVASMFKRSRVPAFSGGNKTVAKSFYIAP